MIFSIELEESTSASSLTILTSNKFLSQENLGLCLATPFWWTLDQESRGQRLCFSVSEGSFISGADSVLAKLKRNIGAMVTDIIIMKFLFEM